MRDVLIALVPALVGSVYFFGFRALTVTAVSMLACFLFEKLYCKLMKKDDKTYDLSACVTGMLLAFVCPPTIAYWQIVLGAAFAILLVKMLFGGVGKNIVNPALAGRAFMFSWPVAMSTWVKVGFENAAGIFSTADAVTAATPLAAMHQGYIDPAAGSIADMFWGNVGGCIGETSAALLLVGFAYLLFKKVIEPTIPACFIGTVAVMALLTGNDPIFHVCAGGVMLGAIFMATDYVTSPITTKGKVIFGVGCGLLTMIIRLYASYPEGVSFAILIMNILTPHIDNLTIPALNGVPKEKKGGDK
jgi:electron transport complex protein RnfD